MNIRDISFQQFLEEEETIKQAFRKRFPITKFVVWSALFLGAVLFIRWFFFCSLEANYCPLGAESYYLFLAGGFFWVLKMTSIWLHWYGNGIFMTSESLLFIYWDKLFEPKSVRLDYWDLDEIEIIELFNTNGQKVLQLSGNNSEVLKSIDLSDFPNGLYFLSIQTKFESQTIKLSKGTHKFILINIKSAAWRAPKLGLSIKSKSTNSKDFHAYDSYPPSVNSTTPIFVNAESKPRLLRAFVAFEGRGKRLSHTIGVATPTGLNYVYDLSSANVIGAWRGDFVDATPMWHNRGDGSFKPRGAVQWTFLNQSIAKLETANSAFPETGVAPEFVSKGYALDKETSLPIFKHNYNGVSIENKITSDASDTYLVREVNFSKTGLTNWYMKIASGKVVKNLDGSYAIGDQGYYINVLSGQIPIIREVNGKTELVLAVDGSHVKYEIIW